MNIKSKIFPEDSKDFPWDEKALKAFKNIIIENDIRCRMDDIFLLGFLRARKYDMERSLRLLKNYYSIRRNQHYFKNLCPSKLEHALSLKTGQFLKQPDQKGRYIFIHQSSGWDLSVCDINDFFRAALLFYDLQLNFHRTQENSVVFIFNAEGLSIKHFLQITPRFFNTLITILFRDSYQMRFQEIHYVNLNPIIRAVLSLIIPLLPAKIKKRIFLHSQMSSLHKFVHPQYLPLEYGGELPSFDPTEANEMIRENEEFFRMNEEYVDKYQEKGNKFAEGTYRYLGDEHEDTELAEALKSSEEKYNKFVEHPEIYLDTVEQEFDLEVTHF